MLRPFSEHRRGLFVSVDGPAGAGKSTIVAHLAKMLTADGGTRPYHRRVLRRAYD